MTLREVVVGHAQHEHVGGHPGVGDEHLDRAEGLLDLGEGGVDLGGVGDVAAHGQDAVGLVGGRRVGAVGDGDLVAVVGEGAGAGEADAAVAAGDEDDPARWCRSSGRPPGGGRSSAARRWPSSCRRRSRRAARGRPGRPGRRRGRRRGPAGCWPRRCCRWRAGRSRPCSLPMPRREHAASMMRMLAWWGTTRAMSSAVTPAAAIEVRADSTITRDGPAEDLLAVHLHVAADGGVEQLAGGAVGAEVEREQLARAVDWPRAPPRRHRRRTGWRCCGPPGR